jgi:putative transposase
MELIRAHVYTLRPTPEQKMLLAQTAGVVRLVYNLTLEQRRIWGGKPYAGGPGRYFSAMGASRDLSALRSSFDWIKAVSQTAQIQAIIDLDRAFANFFEGRASYPTPRRKGLHDAFRQVGREITTRRLNAKWSEVRIPKIGWIRYRDTRPLRPGESGEVEIRNATLRRRAGGGWEIAIAHRCAFNEIEVPAGTIGVDRGVAAPYATSDGMLVQFPDRMEKRERTIRQAQRKLSRKRRGSKRYARARQRVARLKARNARARKHVAHVTSRTLVRENGLVAIEALQTRNMVASASGTREEPGRNVAQKRGLNRAILNVGWQQFEVMLAYKLEETGGRLVKVPAAYSSQECAACGHVDRENRKSQAVFVCTACGAADNADINAAKVIRDRALRGDTAETRRWNTPLLDVEGNALAPVETSTPGACGGVNAPTCAPEIHLSSGGGRC